MPLTHTRLPAPLLPSPCSALEEDATLAAEKLNNSTLQGRKISVVVARNAEGGPGAAGGADGPAGAGAGRAAASSSSAVAGMKRRRPEDKTDRQAPPKLSSSHPVPGPVRGITAILLGIAPDVDKKRLWKRVRKCTGAKDMQFPVQLPGGEDVKAAIVKFDTPTHREAAIRALNGKALHGGTFAARRADDLLTQLEAFSKSRLIVRNLRFDATAEHIRAAFVRHGATCITSIHVPLKAEVPGGAGAAADAMDVDDKEDDAEGSDADEASGDGEGEEEEGGSDEDGEGGAGKKRKRKSAPSGPRNRGFAFVEFATRADAQAAMTAVNEKKVHKRVVAVDWAIPPAAYKAAPAASASAASAEKGEKKDAKKDDEEDTDGMDVEDDAEADKEDDGDDAGDDDDDDAAGDDDEAADEDEDEDEDDDEEDGAGGKPAGRAGSVASGDTNRTGQTVEADPETLGCTLFVRNVAFDTDEKELIASFRAFGPVHYATLVKDRETGMKKGTAFVKFYTKEGADRALAAAGAPDEHSGDFRSDVEGERADVARRRSTYAAAVDAALLDGGIKAGGRVLLVRRAISKDEAAKLAEQGKDGVAGGKKYDKRHTYLAHEGAIRAGSDAAARMPKTDLQKREEATKAKKTKLQSPLFFVSPTRLSVRNLARHVDDAMLRELARAAATAGLEAGLVDPKEGDPRLMPAPGDKPPKLFILTARVLREAPLGAGAPVGAGASRARMEADGVTPRSKGFAFVEFGAHIHALACLRELNNNLAYSSYASGGSALKSKPEEERPRLIVEFAVENIAKVREHEAKKAAGVARRKAMAVEGIGARGAGGGGGGGGGRWRDEGAGAGAGAGASAGAGAGFGAGAGARGPRGDRFQRGRDGDRRDGSAGPAQRRDGSAATRDRSESQGPQSKRVRFNESSEGRGRNQGQSQGQGQGPWQGQGQGRPAPHAARGGQVERAEQQHGRPASKPPRARHADQDAEFERILGSGPGPRGGAGAGGGDGAEPPFKQRRAAKKQEKKDDADHDRIVENYKKKLFGAGDKKVAVW
jgi:nucleolar protein 4